MPAWSTQIANEFLRLASVDGRAVDLMQLQKLVYVAHGWCLAASGQPLTGEAWINNSDATVLQQKLGVTADGLFGKGSNTALQSYLGVTADGIFGVESVKALQTRLNAGTFFS